MASAPVLRAAASKGPADLLMAHPFLGPALVQVGTVNKSIGPDDRARFLAAAEMCCSLAILATAGDRKPITYWEIGPGPASTWTRWEP